MYLALGAIPPQRSRVPGRFSRRVFIKRLAAGFSLAALGLVAYRILFGKGKPAAGNRVLTAEEMATVEAVAEAFFPGPPQVPVSAAQAQVPRFIDGYVADLPEDRARLFRLLLRGLELSTVASDRARFSRITLERRLEILEGWDKSRLYPRRTAYRSLRFACAMGYFENEAVRAAVGWRLGCIPT